MCFQNLSWHFKSFPKLDVETRGNVQKAQPGMDGGSQSHRHHHSSNSHLTMNLRNLFKKTKDDWSSFENVKCPREYVAMQGLEGSIRAVMHALHKRGISDHCLLEIERCMEAGKHRLAVDHCMRYLDSCFQYDQDLVQLMIHAWQALCQYHGLRHKRAYRECRPEEDKPFPPRYKRARQNALAEVCTSQVTGLYKLVKWQEYLQAREAANKRYEERQREKELEQALIILQQSLEEELDDEQEQEAEEQEVGEVQDKEQRDLQQYFKEELVDEQEQEVGEVQANEQQDMQT